LTVRLRLVASVQTETATVGFRGDRTFASSNPEILFSGFGLPISGHSPISDDGLKPAQFSYFKYHYCLDESTAIGALESSVFFKID
jgi:hypothetical protein